MSQTKANRGRKEGNGLIGRTRGVVVTSVPAGVRQARRWTAPRMEGLADVVETRITPMVTSTLRRGARKVRPEQESRMMILTRSMKSWRGVAALLTALGAAGAAAGYAIQKRYFSSTAEAEKASSDAAGSVPAGSTQGGEPVPDNGRVSSSW